MKTSPTQRSLAYLRKHGWTCCVVEQHIRPPGRERFGFKRDAFGFGDILAVRVPEVDYGSRSEYDSVPEPRIALVQVTTGSNLAARVTKILAEPQAKTWLEAGGRIYVLGWRKIGARGKRKLWRVDERAITLEMFNVAAETSESSAS